MMSKLEDTIEKFSEELEQLGEYTEKAIERGNRTVGTNAYFSEKVEDCIEELKTDIERLKILLSEAEIDYIDTEKFRKSLTRLKKTDDLSEVKESVQSIEEEIRTFRVHSELKGYSELPESVEEIIDLLDDRFDDEKDELKDVYGRNSLSTAFLLRRILEKSIFFSFANAEEVDKIKDSQGNFVGLKDMINEARGFEYKEGKVMLDDRTGEKVHDVKFLGDVAAHNFLRTVSMTEIDAEIHKLKAALEELPITEGGVTRKVRS